MPGDEPVDVAGLGLCYPVRPHVVAVRPDSPAAKAGLKPGDVINALVMPPTKPTTLRGLLAWIRSLLGWDRAEPNHRIQEESPELVRGLDELAVPARPGSRADRQQRVQADQDHARHRSGLV